MKKKLIDMTIGEMRAICNKGKSCRNCPLLVEGTCAFRYPSYLNDKELKKEIDV